MQPPQPPAWGHVCHADRAAEVIVSLYHDNSGVCGDPCDPDRDTGVAHKHRRRSWLSAKWLGERGPLQSRAQGRRELADRHSRRAAWVTAWAAGRWPGAATERPPWAAYQVCGPAPTVTVKKVETATQVPDKTTGRAASMRAGTDCTTRKQYSVCTSRYCLVVGAHNDGGQAYSRAEEKNLQGPKRLLQHVLSGALRQVPHQVRRQRRHVRPLQQLSQYLRAPRPAAWHTQLAAIDKHPDRQPRSHSVTVRYLPGPAAWPAAKLDLCRFYCSCRFDTCQKLTSSLTLAEVSFGPEPHQRHAHQ